MREQDILRLKRQALQFAITSDIITTALDVHSTTGRVRKNMKADLANIVHNAAMRAWKNKSQESHHAQ